MFRVFRSANICLVVVFLKLTVGDQESLSYANCQLTNTCFGRSTDDLTSERPTTPKIIEKEQTSNTQTTLGASENVPPLPTHSLLSLHTKYAPSTETTCIGLNTDYFNATLYTTTPISLTKVTNKISQATTAVTEESTFAMTTVDALKSSQAPKTSEVKTIKSVWKFDISFCSPYNVVKVKDLIYVLSRFSRIDNEGIQEGRLFAILAYEDNIPHDLVMITITEDIADPGNMVGIENTNLLYVDDEKCHSFWKIDTVNNTVDKWMSYVGDWPSLTVANDNHLLVLMDSKDPQYLEIYDQDAKLVRRVSLPNDFKGPFNAIQKPNGEFIVSHYLKESIGVSVSFLSAKGEIISQFKLRERGGFKDIQVFFDFNNDNYFITEMCSGNVCIRDEDTGEWKLTNLYVTISNDSEGSSGKILIFKTTDGRNIKKCAYVGKIYRQYVRLFWDAEDDCLLASGGFTDDIYLFNAITLKWSHLGKLRNNGLYYDTKKKQLISLEYGEMVHIWTLSKN